MATSVRFPRAETCSPDGAQRHPGPACSGDSGRLLRLRHGIFRGIEQTHSLFVSLFPNWLGQTQPRAVEIEGDMLHLSSTTPIMSGGKKTMSYLSWKRAEPNV